MRTEFARNLASIEILRFPRTRHLEGSRIQEKDSKAVQILSELKGVKAFIEEKVDGANSAISFTDGAELLLQSRGHYLQGGAREKQFALMHQWAIAHEDALLQRLEDRFVMYGEWSYAKHSIFYDQLPHYFHEFDIWDRKECHFLSTPRRHALLAGMPVLSVPVLYAGEMPTESQLVWKLVKPSLAKGKEWRAAFEKAVSKKNLDKSLCWKQTDKDDRAEGLYIKVEDDEKVLGRFKLVRENFTQTILDSESHHSKRPIIPNGLMNGVDLYSPALTKTWADCGLKTIGSLKELKDWN